jgi:hypothetical protein
MRESDPRWDNEVQSTPAAFPKWLIQLSVDILFFEPRSPWQDGHVLSFNRKLRAEPPRI